MIRRIAYSLACSLLAWASVGCESDAREGDHPPDALSPALDEDERAELEERIRDAFLLAEGIRRDLDEEELSSEARDRLDVLDSLISRARKAAEEDRLEDACELAEKAGRLAEGLEQPDD